MRSLCIAAPASLVAVGCLLLTAGCAPAPLLARHVEAPGVIYDAQECVENSMRRGADPMLVPEALQVFRAACDTGEAAACSALGVMYEIGFGVPRAPRAALRLYRRACSAKNTRACANLGEALLSDAAGARDPVAAEAILRVACDGGQARACAALGRAYRAGAVVAPAAVATSFLEMACQRGEASACSEVAGVPSGFGRPEAEQRQRGLAKACAGGESAACDHLAESQAVAIP